MQSFGDVVVNNFIAFPDWTHYLFREWSVADFPKPCKAGKTYHNSS